MKKNKKKKAFTLIELLAVIVILAIIALIVTISIGRLLDNAKKETFKESVIGVLRSAELYMGKYVLENKSEPAYPMVFACNGVECSNGTDTLEISGKVPKSGSITMANHKTVTANYLSDGKYCVAGTKTDLQVANSCADIDVTKPTINGEAEGLMFKITMTDNESGIASYCVTNENTASNCIWIDTTDNYKEHMVESVGTYYVFAKDKKGNISNVIELLSTNPTFADKILIDNPIILTNPSLDKAITFAQDAFGLYSMSVTNGFGGADGTTYYFRGNVDNNYVSFADKTWRIVRVNEDGTVRLILEDSIDANVYKMNSVVNSKEYIYMYYSNSDITKQIVNNWYSDNIIGDNSLKVATGNYFCEAAKTHGYTNWNSGLAQSTVYMNYTPNLACVLDGNGKGLVSAAIGLINLDELWIAGGYVDEYTNREPKYYLAKTYKWWTMSPSGFDGNYVWLWGGWSNGQIATQSYDLNERRIRPVINLKAEVTVTGAGISTDPYVVE